MSKYFSWILLLIIFGVCPSTYAKEVKVKYKADKVEYLKQEDVFRLIGNVEVKVKDITIKTEQLDYNTGQKVLSSNNDFTFIQTNKKGEKTTIKGKSFIYNVGIKRIEAIDVYLTLPAKSPGQEIFLKGKSMTGYENGKRMVFVDGFYTTCSHFDQKHHAEENTGDPYAVENVKNRIVHYAMEADILDFVKNDRVIAWNATIIAFDARTFWFPYWYIPLEGIAGIKKPDIDIGQNPVEGNFIKFKGYYKFNDFHDGEWYLTTMEKKGLGLGFKHDWIAVPNSITRFYFYGIPISTGLTDVPGSLFYPPSSNILTTQQSNDASFLSPLLTYGKNKFEDHHFKLFHKQKLLDHTSLDIEYEDLNFYSWSAFTPNRQVRNQFKWSLTDNQIFKVDPQTNLKVDTTLKFNKNRTDNNIRKIIVNPQASPTTDPTTNTIVSGGDITNGALPSNTTNQSVRNRSTPENRNANISLQMGKSNLKLNTNWQSTQTSSLTENFQNDSLLSTQTKGLSNNENWTSNLNFNTPINDKVNLTSSLVYNSTFSLNSPANKTLQPRVSLNQRLDWGTLDLIYEDFFSFSENNQNAGRLKKLPELDIKGITFFKETFPVGLQTVFGRYFEQASNQSSPTSNLLNEIARNKIKLSLNSKQHDLGMGMKLNFSGTSFEQRFYQTQDAEYSFRAQAKLRNDLSPFFIPEFTYNRTVLDDENNNSPFKSYENLALSKQNRVTGSLSMVNLPEFTWTVNSGYDYIARRYNLLNTNIRSNIGNNFTFNFQTSYNPIQIKDTDVGKELKDSAGNIYMHGEDKETFLVKQSDVGSFSPYGGQWGTSTLGLRYRSSEQPLNIGSLSNFGKDDNIPQGLEIGSAIAYDFHRGRINSLNNEFKFSFGESWLWHTELELILSVQPIDIQTAVDDIFAIEMPFKLVIRKDLHDFIFTASWDSFYQQLNFDIALLAFPSLSTSKLVDQAGQNLQQTTQSIQSTTQKIGQ